MSLNSEDVMKCSETFQKFRLMTYIPAQAPCSVDYSPDMTLTSTHVILRDRKVNLAM